MSILENIVRAKKKEIKSLKERVSVSSLEKFPLYDMERPSFAERLSEPGPSIIAEFKRKSPSKGQFIEDADLAGIVSGYEKAGASAVSILTDSHFDGRKEDISTIAGKISIPILRKDFIVDEIQIVEARAIGASAILLIAAILSKEEIKNLKRIANELKLDVLLEIHDWQELSRIPDDLELIGINNRDLRSFEVDIERSVKMAEELPAHMVKVSESGLSSADTVFDLYEKGFQAFLMGENFMKMKDPAKAAQQFILEVSQKFRSELKSGSV